MEKFWKYCGKNFRKNCGEKLWTKCEKNSGIIFALNCGKTSEKISEKCGKNFGKNCGRKLWKECGIN